MGEYLSPGVYVEEVSSGTKPIEGVGTSTGGFVGIAEWGPFNKATLVTNWTQYVNTFGSFTEANELAYGVYNFFNEGGTKCFVTRVGDGIKASSAEILFNVGTEIKGKITALQEGTFGNRLQVAVVQDGKDKTKFDFVLSAKNNNGKYETLEVFPLAGITTKTAFTTLLSTSSYIKVDSAAASSPVTIYDSTNGSKPQSLTGGNDGIPGTGKIVSTFSGDPAKRTGLYAFDVIDEVNIIAIPDAKGDKDTMAKGFNYCENRKDCFFVADTTDTVVPADVANSYNSSYGALYYPWLEISNPLGGKRFAPPSGAVTGIISRTDVNRGVHKAPAGTLDGKIRSAVGLKQQVTKGEHDVLNPKNINVIRSFPGTGICVWGARTTSSDSEWKYVNIRRLFLMVEESIDESSQWVTFEPNDPALWGNVKRNITAFLTRLWRDGALYGTTAEQAFFVKVDEENNPPTVRDAGQLIIEVGIAPVKPAEFVIIRISQKTLTK